MSPTRPTKQTQRAVAISQQAALGQWQGQPSALSKLLTERGEPTKLQRKIATATMTQAGIIDASRLLHEWGSENIARTHVISQRSAFRTFGQFNAVVAAAADPDTLADVQAWTAAQKELYIRHESALLDGIVTNIVQAATKPLPNTEEETPKRTGVLGWVLGGRRC